MYSFALIGMTGQGKSRYAHRMIKEDTECNVMVWDVNNEYGTHPTNPEWSLHLSTNINSARCRYTGGDPGKFIELCGLKRDCIIVFEEATAFFKGQIGKNLVELVIRKRHTNNRYVFLFHSIRAIPPALLDFLNYVILFKTSDNIQIVKDKHHLLLQPFMQLQKMKTGSYIIIKLIDQ